MLQEKRYTEATFLALFEENNYWKYSYLNGFFLSLSQEKPSFKTKIVRLLSENFVDPLTRGGYSDSMVHDENGNRSCFKYQAIVEKDLPRQPLTKEGGVYWIVGGLGGLGKIFANHMSHLGHKITPVYRVDLR